VETGCSRPRGLVVCGSAIRSQNLGGLGPLGYPRTGDHQER
jgi:hypothetical protein